MSLPKLTARTLVPAPDRPLLLLGPSIGTSTESLWGRCAEHLRGHFHVVGWDLTGGGAPFTVAELAAAVLSLADRPRFCYAGVSLGGTVGLQLLLDAPDRVESAVLLCTGATIGAPATWRERAAAVRESGTAALADAQAGRWFAPGFRDREPAVVEALLRTLRETDRATYADACLALAEFDVRDRLAEITAPVLAIAGRLDGPTPPEKLAQIARGVRYGRLAVLDDVAHLAPAEQPETVATLIREHLGSPGMAVRRAVLGDTHVDAAVAGTTGFTADFQDLITRYAWGEIWARPGLDRRSRSLITLTALVALGHRDEFALHVRAARANGLSAAEIKEVLLQTAVYCGVPAANTAFRIAQQVLSDLDDAR